jgi:heme-degrading monooxygenase HmoA
VPDRSSNTHARQSGPILKKQTGFVDETVLVSDPEPNRVLAISFWNTKEDAERYQREEESRGRDTRT